MTSSLSLQGLAFVDNSPELQPLPIGFLKTREEWMQAFTNAARPKFSEVGAPLPDLIRTSIGHPSKGIRSKVIGECWTNAASADGAVEIFIRPTLQDDAARLADVLTHELAHAALGNAEGHGPNFRKLVRKLGLEGKPTATVAGDGWRSWALPILEALGPLPGAKLIDLQLSGGTKTQTTRYLKVTCDCCGWQARVTAKHLEGRSLRCPDVDCEGELGRAE